MRVAAVRAAVKAAKEKVKIDLYYDVTSPYAWFGFEVLNRYKTHWKIDLHLKPALLAGIGQAAGTIAPAMKPNRAPYMVKDLHRSAAYFHVPLKMPSDVYELMFVKGSLIPSRFLTAIDMLHPTHLEATSRQLWLAAWSRDQDITSGEVLAAAGLAAGLTPEALAEVREQMSQLATKQRLRAHTDEAVGYGAFGVPSVVAHIGGEAALFFGSDRFPILAQEIGETWMGPEPDIGSAKL